MPADPRYFSTARKTMPRLYEKSFPPWPTCAMFKDDGIWRGGHNTCSMANEGVRSPATVDIVDLGRNCQDPRPRALAKVKALWLDETVGVMYILHSHRRCLRSWTSYIT